MGVGIAMMAFVLSHVLISRTPLRAWLISRLGQALYLAAYSLLSLVMIGWVIGEVLSASRVLLWPTPLWSYGFAAIVMLMAFMLIGIGAVSPNPLSVGFRNQGFDPDRPGFIGWVRHPLIWGLTLWGVAHIPANGDWPTLLLFAGAALFGAVSVRLIERRHKRDLGCEVWAGLSAGRGHLDANSLIGAGAGLALWGLVLASHAALFGADPLAVLLSIVSG